MATINTSPSSQTSQTSKLENFSMQVGAAKVNILDMNVRDFLKLSDAKQFTFLNKLVSVSSSVAKVIKKKRPCSRRCMPPKKIHTKRATTTTTAPPAPTVPASPTVPATPTTPTTPTSTTNDEMSDEEEPRLCEKCGEEGGDEGVVYNDEGEWVCHDCKKLCRHCGEVHVVHTEICQGCAEELYGEHECPSCHVAWDCDPGEEDPECESCTCGGCGGRKFYCDGC